MTRPANTEAVVNAWLATIPGITADMVDETLPPDATTWAAKGFITPAGAGGTPDLYFRVGHPIVMLKFWAVAPNTGLPPWNKARNLAEVVRAGCLTHGVGSILTLENADEQARVVSAYLKTEPRRSFGDVGDYACYWADLTIHWAPYAA